MYSMPGFMRNPEAYHWNTACGIFLHLSRPDLAVEFKVDEFYNLSIIILFTYITYHYIIKHCILDANHYLIFPE